MRRESDVSLATMARLYGAVARQISRDGRYREIRAYVKEANEVVRGEKERRNLEALFRWFCRLLLASIDVANLKKEPGWTSEAIMTKMRPSFESLLPRVETIYLYLGFVRAIHVRAAEGRRAETRLVAYALFSEMGSPTPVLHVAKWSSGNVGLIVYAECIDGEWEIHYTPLERTTVARAVGPGAARPTGSAALRFEPVVLRKWRGFTRQNGAVALRVYSIESRAKSNAGNALVWAALSLLRTFAPIAVPTPVSNESNALTPVLLNEYDQAQLEVYRRIAKHFRYPFPRYGRTLLSILRTWGVVGDEVAVDRQLLDVLYKYEGGDCVAIDFRELERYVAEAKEAKSVYGALAFAKVNDAKCTGKNILIKRSGKAIPVKRDELNAELVVGSGTVPKVLFARPAAEFAAIMGADKKDAVSVEFTPVRGWDEGTKAQNPTPEAEQEKLLGYWALVYRMLVKQTDHSEDCLEQYQQWYEKAFTSVEPVYVSWVIPSVQSVATIPLMSYVIMRVQRDENIVGAKIDTRRIYRRKSHTAFQSGKLIDGRLIWHRTVHLASMRKRNREIYGPYFSEKEVRLFAESTDRDGRLRIQTDDKRHRDAFVLKCNIPPITLIEKATDAETWAFIGAQFSGPVEWALYKVTGGAKAVGAGVAGLGVSTALGYASYFTIASSVAGWTAATTLGSVGIIVAGVTGGAVLGAGGVYGLRTLFVKSGLGQWIWGKFRRSALESKRLAEGGEAPSAETPVKEETFDLASFFVDTTAGACEVVRHNAHLAAQAYEVV